MSKLSVHLIGVISGRKWSLLNSLLFCIFREEVPESLVLSLPKTEINSKVLEDLQNDRNNMTSEGCCETDEHCKDMEDRQPDVNQNGVHRIYSLKSDTVSPGAFTSLHGLSILSEQNGTGWRR